MRRFWFSRTGLLKKSLLSAALLSNLLMPYLARAQAKSITADIPFAFQSGPAQLPAGSYRIAFRSKQMILLQSKDGKLSTYAMVNPEERSNRAMPGKLVFYRMGGRLFLKEIWAPEQAQGSKVVKSDAERRLLAASLFSPGPDAEMAVLDVPVL